MVGVLINGFVEAAPPGDSVWKNTLGYNVNNLCNSLYIWTYAPVFVLFWSHTGGYHTLRCGLVAASVGTVLSNVWTWGEGH